MLVCTEDNTSNMHMVHIDHEQNNHLLCTTVPSLMTLEMNVNDRAMAPPERVSRDLS